MIWALLILVFFIFAIGLAFYYDYKDDKSGFKRSLYGGIAFVVGLILLLFFSDLINKLWYYIFK